MLRISACADPVLESLKGAQEGAFRYFHYDDKGIMEYKLEGETPTFLEGDEVTIAHPHFTLFHASGNISVKATHALFQKKINTCIMTGGVSAHGTQGVTFFSEQAELKIKEQMVIFPTFFQSTEKRVTITGDSGQYLVKESIFSTSGNSLLEYIP